jgi:hypothetical protein
MNTIRETVEIGGRILVVEPKKALEIRRLIAARLKRDARITEELKQGNMLPSGFRNQTARWSRPNYSGNDTIDRRAINSVVRGMITPVIETRFPDTLRREWTA